MTIYKKDSTGKIRFMTVISSGAEIIQTSGVIGTDKELKHTKTAKPKNEGRSNSTTAEEQAVLEVESILKSKLQEGYFKTIKEAEGVEFISPMLAKEYGKEMSKIDWNDCYIQPKLDGQRCLAHISGDGEVLLMSRDGRKIEGMEHITKELSQIKSPVILDGELYAHGKTFQENMKLIKKYRPGESEEIRYNVYDLISSKPFYERYMDLIELLKKEDNRIYITNIALVPTVKLVNPDEDLKTKHLINVEAMFEGSIIRWGKEGYKVNARSSNLLKYKDFLDEDAIILDIIPADQRPEWGVPVLRFVRSDLNQGSFRAGLKYSHEDRKLLLTNKSEYIGKIANIRFFEYTDEGLPRFPVMYGVSNDR